MSAECAWKSANGVVYQTGNRDTHRSCLYHLSISGSSHFTAGKLNLMF